MNITHVRLDDTLGGGEGIDNPSSAKIMDLFRIMDGKRYTELVVEIELGEQYMTIGGGNAAGYICSIQSRDDIFTLLKPSADPENCEEGDWIWIVAGQGSDYPRDKVVSREFVLKALQYYLEHGEPSVDLNWQML